MAIESKALFDTIVKSFMNASQILPTLLATVVTCSAEQKTIDDFAPHFSTNAQIVWKAPTSSLPKNLWVYKILPNLFTAPVISNAIVLASFQSKGFPQPSTNQIILWDHAREVDDPLAGSFSIYPAAGQISFNMKNHQLGSPKGIPSDEVISKRAWDCALLLGLNRAQLLEGKFDSSHCMYNENGGLANAGDVSGREVSLDRTIDGVDFMGPSEGFSIEFGSQGMIRSFELNWPNIERFVNLQTFTPAQIISFIRANQTIVVPEKNEESYFQRIKSLSQTKIFTITKITLHYGEGLFGEIPKENDNAMPKYITPFAELQAVADFGKSNATVRLVAPIILFHESQKLENKAK